MSPRLRRLATCALGLAMLLAMVPAVPAQADDEATRFQAILTQVTAAPDIRAASRTLSPSDQTLLAKGLRVVRVEATSAKPKAATQPTSSGKLGLAAPLRGFCPDAFGNSISGWNAFGGELWRYTLDISFCWDNTYVTSYSYNRYPSNLAPFWNFSGHIGLTQSGGAGQTSAYTWTQGSFTLCFPYCGVQNMVPQVWNTVYGSGAPATYGSSG